MSSLLKYAKLAIQWCLLAAGLIALIEKALVGLKGTNCVRILYGHHVYDDGHRGGLTRRQFEARLRWLRRRYEMLSLQEAVERLERGERLKRGIAVITFDDGYRDNYRNAIPILRELGIPSTFFVATGPLVQGIRLWYDQVGEWIRQTDQAQIEVGWANEPLALNNTVTASQHVVEELKKCEEGERQKRIRELVEKLQVVTTPPTEEHETISQDELAEMARTPGIGIGGHTVTHPILPTVSNEQARYEITESAAHLEGILGRRPVAFAYPNGEYAAEHIPMAQDASYKIAVTTALGVNFRGQDAYRLNRIPLGYGPLCQFAWQTSIQPLLQSLRRGTKRSRDVGTP